MSSEIEENPVHIGPVDVDSPVKENDESCAKSCDSGVESADSFSTTLSASPHCEVPVKSVEKTVENDILIDLKNDSEMPSKVVNSHDLSTSTCVTPDINDATENLLSLDEFSYNKTNGTSLITDHINKSKEESSGIVDDNVVSPKSTDNSSTNSSNDLQSENIDEGNDGIGIPEPDHSIIHSDLENKSIRSLTTSTVSLNDHRTTDNNTTISKSPYSRSAENISVTDQNMTHNLNSSTKELNTEKILSQFSNQKSKVAAIQNITLEIPKAPETQNLDVRYTRLPKELLSQDLGSIVKNVHGIFSSVSGSLKYAYNQTHRAPKPAAKIVTKTIPNGKVMQDIFEDEAIVKSTNITNGVEQSQSPVKIEEVIKINDRDDENEIDNDPKREILRLQIASLERVLADQRKENASLRERVKQQVDELQEKDQTFKELEVKIDQMSKRVEQAEREKDAAVMRYASVECAAIEARRAADKAAAAERANSSEVELLNNKLKSASQEKARICQLYDDKCHELSNSERELAKVREDVKELEGRLKWTQSKLRMEMDAYKDSAERAEKLSQQVTELEAARDAAAANATDSARAKQLEQDLKESQAALILCRHEKEELERRLGCTAQQLDSCRREKDVATTALAQATAEVSSLQANNLRLSQEAAELAALRAQAALADTLSAQLQRETERASQAEDSLSRERARADTCARREAAALEHAARVTALHVQQQAHATHHENKAQALSADNAALRTQVTELQAEVTRLQAELAEEGVRRTQATRALARKVAELTEEAAEANKKLEWEKGENAVLKKKHANAIKEVNRELQRALKRCEQLEAKLPPPDAASTRAGSISSLSSGESAATDDRLHNGQTNNDALPDIHVREPDRQQLIERIVSLQRAAARRSERCEFLEEHSRQLTAELRGKSRLLRQLLCSLPAGAVASPHSDAHKKEIARLGGGAMAAVWGGDAGGMTLELSLEMNSKLQAVLEDALLKNITLKENMDTLGEEIARLKEQMKTNTENKS